MIIQSKTFVCEPHLSIVIITYNQETTIAQTIESVLFQKCDFPFEIIIGEDFGTDKTRLICKEFQQKYPTKIKLILEDFNKGIVGNYSDCMKACKGKYIAQSGGDDYWIDEFKLQKQVNFLERNVGYGFVRTGGYYLKEKSNKMGEITFYSRVVGDNVFEIAKHGPVGIASSICFETDLLRHIDFEEFIRRKFSMEDYPMHAIFSKHTKFGFIPDLCVVYRVTNGSASSPNNKKSKLKYYEGYIAIKLYLSELYPDEIKCDEEVAKNFMLHKHLKFAFEEFNYSEAKKIALQFKNPNRMEKKLKRFTENILLFYLSSVYKKIIKVYEQTTSHLHDPCS